MEFKHDLNNDISMVHFNDGFYDRYGYALLGKTLTHRKIIKMRRECMESWNELKGKYDQSQNWLKNTLLQDIHHYSQEVRDFYFYGPLVEIMKEIIGPNIKSVQSQLSFKLPGNHKGVGWHQDNGYGELSPYNTVTSITALDDADTENGCLWIIPSSHKSGQLDIGYEVTVEWKNQLNEIDMNVDGSESIPVPLKAGESIIFHCLMFHKSEPNQSKRNRRFLFMRYADADAVEVYNHHKPRLGKLLCGHTKYLEVENFERNMS